VVAKAEHLSKGTNPRFVVTSLSRTAMKARPLYEEFYCARGEMENRIKEQQLALFADRTSTAYLRSNPLRLYLSSFAYCLMQALRRLGLAGTEMAKAQCQTIRLRLLKMGAQIQITVRKVLAAPVGGTSRGGTLRPNLPEPDGVGTVALLKNSGSIPPSRHRNPHRQQVCPRNPSPASESLPSGVDSGGAIPLTKPENGKPRR
jgi:hypothetical protein